jgi:hypothetical protein
MKRIATILVIAALFSANIKSIQAQEDTNRWDARVGLGLFSIQDLSSLYTTGLSANIDGAYSINSTFFSLITPNIEMSYACNPYISIGAQLTLGYSAAEYKYYDDDNRSNYHLIYPSLMANLKANYFKHNNFSMYGLFGLGFSTYIVIDNPAYSSTYVGISATPMINFYPLCLSTNKDNGFFMELGCGSKGFINLGWEVKL